MPPKHADAATTELLPDDFYRYDAVKARVLALSRDEAVVLLAVALDPTPRPIRTASILGTANVERTEGSRFDARNVADVYSALTEAQFIVTVDRQLDVDPMLELAAVMAAFARVAAAGKRVAAELLRMTGYEADGFAEAEHTDHGVYVAARVAFDEGTAKGLLNRISGR